MDGEKRVLHGWQEEGDAWKVRRGCYMDGEKRVLQGW